MGRILAPYGVKGWLKVATHSETPESLSRQAIWWLGKGGDWQEARIAEVAPYGKGLIARIDGCANPEQAAGYRGRDVAVARESLPPTRVNEFYQTDLIGLEVRNLEDERLGTVAELFSNGAHVVLRLTGDDGERLVPFIAQVVRGVDLGSARITVDWGKDW